MSEQSWREQRSLRFGRWALCAELMELSIRVAQEKFRLGSNSHSGYKKLASTAQPQCRIGLWPVICLSLIRRTTA